MKKIYCKNCKWFKMRTGKTNFRGFRNEIYTILEEAVCLYDSPTGIVGYGKRYINANKRNKNNDCPDYQRKWWKFWVK